MNRPKDPNPSDSGPGAQSPRNPGGPRQGGADAWATAPGEGRDEASGQSVDPYTQAGAGEAPRPMNPLDAAAWEEELAKARAEAEDFRERYMRAVAETENARRRGREDVAKANKFGIESFAQALIPVVDSLEAALSTPNATAESYREGIEITLRQLTQAFERNQLAQVAPAEGDRFDPNVHQAISMVPSEVPAQHVVSTLQKGYVIGDRVLRPAMVTVSQGPATGR